MNLKEYIDYRINKVIKGLIKEEAANKYWMGSIPKTCDITGEVIVDEFIDGKTIMGPWAKMTPKSFKEYGRGLGVGKGQKYKKQKDGKWLNITPKK